MKLFIVAISVICLISCAPKDEEAGTSSTTTERKTAFLELNLDAKILRFLETPNSTFAANIAAEMGQTGNRLWAPWLMDVLQLGFSSETILTSTRALQDITGIESSGNVADDAVLYGSWIRSEALEPRSDYKQWKLAFLGALDPSYPKYLQNINDLGVLAGIRWGGVRRGGIPELNYPEHVKAREAKFLTPDELVIGVIVNETPIAYPLRFINHHELVNDVVDDTPLTLGYCSLCRSGVVYLTELTEEILTFQTSGLLIDSNKIMVDNNTDSLWQHLRGESISGPMTGTKLDSLSSVSTTWSSWTRKHPDSLTIATPETTWFANQPERKPIAYDYTPNAAYKRYYAQKDLWFPTLTTPTTLLDLKEEVVGVSLPNSQLAIPINKLDDLPIVEHFGAHTLLVVPSQGGARVYKADRTRPLDQIAVEQTQEKWNEASVSIALRNTSGQKITFKRLNTRQMFWFAWYALHPETVIWDPTPESN